MTISNILQYFIDYGFKVMDIDIDISEDPTLL
jgi:hypothetical protein